MKELLAHCAENKLSVAQVGHGQRSSVSGRAEAEINAFIDKVTTAMVSIVKTGLSMPPAVLPGPIKLKTKAGEVYRRAKNDPAGQGASAWWRPSRWPARKRTPAAIWS